MEELIEQAYKLTDQALKFALEEKVEPCSQLLYERQRILEQLEKLLKDSNDESNKASFIELLYYIQKQDDQAKNKLLDSQKTVASQQKQQVVAKKAMNAYLSSS